MGRTAIKETNAFAVINEATYAADEHPKCERFGQFGNPKILKLSVV